jgi:hypothetical protein
MTIDPKTVKGLEAAAAKAQDLAATAKQGVRSAKARLKQARKIFKAAKKAAKQARRKVDAVGRVTPQTASKATAKAAPKPTPRSKPKPKASSRPAPKPKARAARKPRAPKPPQTMRTAAEVAKSVIERLHSPPPSLPATPAAVTETGSPSTAPNSRESGS